MRMLLLFLLTFPLAAADFAHAPAADLLAWYGQLRTAALDPDRAAVAENIVLAKDAARFQLKTGTLYFLQPVGDRVAGAVFLGEAVLTLDPPLEAERRHLARELKGATRLEESFSEAVLLFSDDTFERLSSQLKFRAEAVPPKAAGLLGDLRHAFREDLRTNVEARLLAGFCFPAHGFFLADIRGNGHGRLMLTYDPQQDEDLQLLHFPHGTDDNIELWSSFRPGGAPAAEHPDFLRVSRSTVDTTIEKNKDMKGESVTEFRALVPGPRLLNPRLARTLRVSKATWGGSKAELEFIQEDKKKDGDLWVILPALSLRTRPARSASPTPATK